MFWHIINFLIYPISCTVYGCPDYSGFGFDCHEVNQFLLKVIYVLLIISACLFIFFKSLKHILLFMAERPHLHKAKKKLESMFPGTITYNVNTICPRNKALMNIRSSAEMCLFDVVSSEIAKFKKKYKSLSADERIYPSDGTVYRLHLCEGLSPLMVEFIQKICNGLNPSSEEYYDKYFKLIENERKAQIKEIEASLGISD